MRLFRECSLAAILESAVMGRKWFLLVGVSGNPLASGAVRAKDEDVDALRDAVKLKCANTLAEVDAVNLTVFANQEAFDAKQPLPKASSPVTDLGKDEDHPLIVAVPTLSGSFQTFRENCARQKRIEVQLEHIVAMLPHKDRKSYSDAALGQIELTRLKKSGSIIEAAPMENGEPFWSEQIQIQASTIGKEAEFDAFITSFFNDVLSSYGLVFVNSERDQWLSQSPLVTKTTDLKPDGFATHPGMFRRKPVPNDGISRGDGFRFGVADEALFDCLILFESKLTISEAAFGQVVRYLQNVCPEEAASAILFDRRSAWLIKSYKSIFKVEKTTWVRKGSKALLQKFIAESMSPWVTRLTKACSLLGVDVVEGDAFLGRGAYGRVFKVLDRDGQAFALKIVEEHSIGRIYDEKMALASAQDTGLTISPVGEVTEILDGAGAGAALLLSPIGIPLPRPTTREEVHGLFGLLWQLHSKGLVHGDPRVPNVIVSDGKPLWIDLVEVKKASPVLKRVDANILARSILSLPHTVPLDPATVQLIENYGNSSTQENLLQLAEAVWHERF
jgi:hypothetical protein